jgi:GEVED domain/Matrixin
MLLSAWLNSVRRRLNSSQRSKKRRVIQKQPSRASEALENRSLLTALVAVRPNVGDFLTEGEVRNIAPQELTLQFSLGESIDPASVTTDSITVDRSGRDGTFNENNEVPVTIGFVGIGDDVNEVVLRFAENLTDDTYRITVRGDGSDIVTSDGGVPFNNGNDDTFDFGLDLAPQVRAVVPMPITRVGGVLTQARDQIIVYFNEDTLDLTAAQNPNFYQLHFTNDTVTNTDDGVPETPDTVLYDAIANTATLTFSGPLDTLFPPSPASTLRLRIGTGEAIPAPPAASPVDPSVEGETFISDFGSSGATFITIEPNSSVDGKPVTLNITTGVGLGNGFPKVTVSGRAVSVELDDDNGDGRVTDARQLFWAINLHPDASKLLVVSQTGDQFFNIGTSFAGQTANYTFSDAGSSYEQSEDLGELTSQARSIRGLIRSIDYPYDFPGNEDEPGHREIDVARESHVEFPPDVDREISTLTYNFQINYGFTPQGVQLSNLITPNQKQRAREIFELYGKYLGVQFVESENLGFTIVSGDMRAIDPTIVTGAGNKLGHSSRLQNLAIMDAAEQWDDSYGGSWFSTAMHEIGHLLGLGHAYDLPDLTVQGGFEGPTVETTNAEPDFPGDQDIVHGRLLYRPESKDIDLYKFNVTDAGLFSAEIIAERMTNSSLLDSALLLFREDSDGNRELISQNDDYFSEDAFVELPLTVGTYFVGVSASGNTAYDPAIADTGIGGTTQGIYDLRLRFRPDVSNAIVDTQLNPLDGDHDGIAGGEFNFWFRAVSETNQLVVDRIAADGGDGSLATPYNRISDAITDSAPGDVIRIVGNPGGDGDFDTLDDNVAYEVGVDELGTPLRDGLIIEIPQDVVLMVDAGALLKLHNSYIIAGSSSSVVDRSGASLQILGTPDTDVVITSLLDENVGGDTTPTPTTPAPGNWGGLVFRRDVDTNENRLNYEQQGIFLDYVTYANLSYGGGKLDIDSVQQVINPITLIKSRPGLYNNFITLSEDSAISADPDSFEESTFRTPIFQQVPFTTDYGRSGPDIYGNLLLNNSTNGLFIRVETAPGSPSKKLTVPGRFDDIDIVHVITQNLEIEGTPGGPFLEVEAPPVLLVTLNGQSGGTLPVGNTLNYRVVYVDGSGTTSPPSTATRSFTLSAGQGSIRLNNLPPAPTPFTGRLIYRSQDGGIGPYELIAVLNASSTQYVDDGTTLNGILDENLQGRLRARTDARLAIDPNVIVKLESSRIEVGMGAQLIAEGDTGRRIVFTSKLDDKYGRGGTFDTNNDDSLVNESAAGPGNWGGIYLSPVSTGSFDYTLLTYAGGIIPTDGDFAGFNAIEVHQADLRLTHSIVEQNADGTGGTAPADRFGRTANAPGTIFVRGAQPVILGNIVRDNQGALLTINVNSLNSDYLDDYGRSRGLALRFPGFESNQGPLISDNLFGRNGINGMVVRGETLTTQSVFDDTDIVHVVMDEIVVPEFHTFGGLRLNSDPDASLVVKLEGADAGFTAGGRPLDIDDRIGGAIQIVGQPFFPVVLTSLADDTVGSGFDLGGLPLRDTNGDGPSTGSPGDWRSVEITKFAHDRNVGVYNENETTSATAPGTNAAAQSAEFVGELGKHNLRKVQQNQTTVFEKSTDDNLRLGFEINGTINDPSDIDVYSFTGEAGMEVWVDVDRTSQAFDPVIEIVSSLGQIIAQSDNSLAENNGDYDPFRNNPLLQANVLNKSLYQSDDWYSLNQRDAGLRIVLPGVAGTVGTYFVRIRSSNIDSLDSAADRSDLQNNGKLLDGKTEGNYQLNLRLREADEIAGTSVTYADIRFATNGIEIYGQPVHSPLTGEFSETVVDNNNTAASSLDMGNLLNTDRAALSIAGRIADAGDVDFFDFEVRFEEIQDIPNHTVTPRYMSVIIDVDYADGMARGNTIASIFDGNGELVYVGRDSNVSDDRSGPLEGADIDDLSRGSAGELDPFIGPVELPEGNYFLVVSSNDQIPTVLDQTLRANPTSTRIRLEPITSIERIGDEHFGGFGTAVAPKFDLFDNEFGQNLTPFFLGDVNLFVADGGNNVYMVNPFTGVVTNTLGRFGTQSQLDIAMRPDGELYSYIFPVGTNDAAASTYVQIDTGTAAPTTFSDDGIVTFNDSNPAVGTIAVANSNAATVVTAFTYFGATTFDGLFVATRGDGRYSPNLLYQFNITNGVARSQGPLRTGNGRVTDNNVPNAGNPSGTDVVEIFALPAVGTIRGIAVLGTSVFAVDDLGEFYEFDLLTGAILNQQTILDPDGNPAVLTGLALGPDEVEGGFFASTMFATDVNGVLYALGTQGPAFGVGQPVFVNGQTMINTGIGATGLDFGTLDRNLWSTTGRRAFEPGHGNLAAQDNTRLDAPGGGSLYLGNQRGGRDAGNKNNLSPVPVNDYNFPGGAHGSFITNFFSLDGYNAADKPVLYFNYWMDTDSVDYQPFVTPQRDSVRVYIGDGDIWNLLGTNDSYRGGGAFDDEQDFGLNGAPTTFPTTQTFRDVVELYDEPGTAPTWRQARVDLSHYAGRDDLRLRFEFATAGAMNVGDIRTVGEEFYIKPGRELRDGQSYIFEGVNQHEIDMGYTLVVPGGRFIPAGETFTIEGVVFEFTKGGAPVGGNTGVAITDGMSPQEVAIAMEVAIDGQSIANATHNLQTYRDNNRINLMLAPPDPPNPGPPVLLNPFVSLSQSAGAAVLVEGAPGITAGTTSVVIHAGMSRSQAAEQVSQSYADLHLPAGAYYESEFNNARTDADAQDLETESWTLTANNTITDSTVLPHISMIATSEIIGGTDYYRIVVPADGTRVVVDIDGTHDTYSNVIRIWDDDPASLFPLFSNSDGGIQDVASNKPSDAFLDVVLDAGTYFIQTGVAPNASGAFPLERYTIHVSVGGHAVDGGATPAAPLIVPRQVVKKNNDLVRVIGHYVSTQGPMALTTSLQGDGFGGYFASLPSLTGVNNSPEGIYIDDIIIGFTERGEMVTGAPNNATFIQNPEVNDPNNPNPYFDILEGAYDVEIRRASDYASSVGAPQGAFQAFDSNDRLTQQQTLIVADSWDLRDGQTFTLSDGVDSVTFEYEDVNAADGVAQGHQPIPFDPIAIQPFGDRTGEPAWMIAKRIRDAINSTAVQGILDVRASLSDGTADPAASSTSNRVNIYGNAIFTLTDGQQDLPSGLSPPQVQGFIRRLGNSNGSRNLFSFTNTSDTNDSLFAYPRWITDITMQLPAGRTYDPNGLFDLPRVFTGNGPTQSPGIGIITPSFALNEQRDILSLTFPSFTDGEFSRGEQLNFGIDIDALGEPEWYIGSIIEIKFSSGPRVLAEFVPDPRTSNTARLRPIEDTTGVDHHDAYGDSNQARDQGQILIQANTISDSLQWGILSDAGSRDGGPGAPRAGNLPHAGPTRNLLEINTDRLVPGILIENNVVAHSGTGGVLFSGDRTLGLLGSVPFGRIVNNTIVGTGSGTGIRVEEFASPTLLNNIVADLTIGVFVDADSEALGTVVGTTLYRGNGTDANTGAIGLGTFPINLSPTDPLFVNESRRNYYLAPLSQAIDSSLDSLNDRTSMNTVRAPLGISVSPIKAPEKDVFGQLRGDDPAVNTPAAQGANVFKDRGAIDRVDFFRPTAMLTNPLDQDVTDLDPALNVVWINEPTALSEFIVSLSDVGIGIDDVVDTTQFQLFQDDVLLIDGSDYVFVYNSTTDEVIFRSVTQYPFETRYRIEIDNDNDATDGVDGVHDLAGNYLAPNQGDGRTVFNILVTDGTNDPPVNDVPGPQVTPEDTDLVFSVVNGNAISVSDADVHLGNNRLLITLTAVNGVLSLNPGSIPSLAFTVGDGTADVTMKFEGDVADINAALEGLRFTPDQDYFGPASLTILSDDQGQFTGPPTPPVPPETDMDTVVITVTPVNDKPTFDPISDPPAIAEDTGPQTVVGFMTGQVAGPPNEMPPQTITSELTVTGTTGSWTPANFFAVLPAIDVSSGNLTYTVADDVNGTATVEVILRDSEGLASDPQTFVLTVNPINDQPVFTVDPVLTFPLTVNEDAGLQMVNLISAFAAAHPGAIDEIGAQGLTWNLSAATVISGNIVFDVLQISPTGVLEFQSAQDTAGVAEMTLTLEDDGASAPPPNDNLSTTFTFRIDVIQVNDAPVAVTGDYIVDEGYSLTLDGSASFDVDEFFGDVLSYEWDVDGDGTYDVGPTASDITVLSWSDLLGLGITAPNVYNLRLRVTDLAGEQDTDDGLFTTLIVDYGDAPDSYGTLQTSSGAAHTIDGVLFMGPQVDNETTGVPTGDALGDDLADLADEDGVVFTTTIETDGSLALPSFLAVTASVAGKVDAWIDFNQNGVFDDPVEHLNGGVSFDVVAGENRLEFTVPAGTPVGDTFARFRISSTGGLTPTGRADDGEVEDYSVKIRPLQAPITPTITKPIDVLPGDGRIPETSDLTPHIEWTFFDANFFYDIEVQDDLGNVVFTQNNVIDTFVDVVPTLAAGDYTVSVIAHNRAGAPAAAANYAFKVVPVIVSSPSGAVGTPRPVVNWNHVFSTKTYTIQIDSLTTGSTVVIATVDATTAVPPNQFTPTSDLPIGRYEVRVRATDAADLDGDWSPFVAFDVRVSPTVTAPTGTIMDSVRPEVTWTSVPGAVSYELQLDNATDNIRPLYRVAGIPVTSWTPPADLNLAEYTVWVRAYNAQGETSFWSPAHSFVIAPRPVAVTPQGRTPDSTPTFSWNPVAQAETYRLLVNRKFGDFGVVIDQAGLTTTLYNQATPMPLGRYSYQIFATNNPANPGGGWAPIDSTPSFVYEFVVTEPPIITKPQSTVFNQRPLVEWTKPLGSGSSEVWIAQSDGIYEFERVANLSGTTYQTTQDFPIGNYVVWVRTLSDTTPSEVSDWSIGKTFRVVTPPVLIGPTGRTPDATPTLSWNGVLGGQTYEVWIDNNSIPITRVINEAGLNSLNFTVATDLPIGRYTWWARARNAFGVNSSWSGQLQFEIVTAPVLSGPPASTFDTTPSFDWNDMRVLLNGNLEGASSYDIRIDEVTNGAATVLQTNGLTGTSYTVADADALAVGNYRAYVRAFAVGNGGNAGGDTVGDWSTPLDFFVGGRPVINPPGSTTDTTPTITWQAVQGANGYDIFIALASDPTNPLITEDGIGTASYEVQQPLAQGEYRVWVRAINATDGTKSLWSNAAVLNIVDADGPESNGPAEGLTTYAVIPAMLTYDGTTESTVSMLPAEVAGSIVAPAMTELEIPEATRPTEEDVRPAAADIQEDAADSVLANWGQQTWWDQPVAAETPVDNGGSDARLTAGGLIGMLMTITPAVFRRRRKES